MPPKYNDQSSTSTSAHETKTINLYSDECWKSWTTYLGSLVATSATGTTTLNSETVVNGPAISQDLFSTYIETYIQKWETMQSFGPNTTYTACDGIPRLRFEAVPTITRPTMVENTSYRTKTSKVSVKKGHESSLSSVTSHNTFPISLSKPTCTPSQFQCNDLWIAAIYRHYLNRPVDKGPWPLLTAVSSNEEMKQRFLRAMNGVCKYRYCLPILGDEVMLMYWPHKVKSRDICATTEETSGQMFNNTTSSGISATVSTNVVQFRGQDLYQREESWIVSGSTTSAVSSSWAYNTPWNMTGDFKFVSPTVYVAHHPITAKIFEITASCNELGCGERTQELPDSLMRPSGIIPVHSTDVSSALPRYESKTFNGLEYAHKMASGLFMGKYMFGNFKRVNFEDMLDPVPASVYFDARAHDCVGKQTHCGTITDGSYRPDIFLDFGFWKSLLPTDEDCGAMKVNDPPVTLVAVNTPKSLNANAQILPWQVTHLDSSSIIISSRSSSNGSGGSGGGGDGDTPRQVDDSTYANPGSKVVHHIPTQTERSKPSSVGSGSQDDLEVFTGTAIRLDPPLMCISMVLLAFHFL